MPAEAPRVITVNGEARESRAATVAELVAELGLPPDAPGVAVAVNDAVVPRSAWPGARIGAGDRVEIVRAVQGG